MKLSGMLLSAGMLLAISFSGYCRSDAQEVTEPAAISSKAAFTACQEPRPVICYEIYAPVCAIQRTGMLTYANDCKACIDPAVQGFETGECR
jgi:hypothetical protein